jgi:type I restriction enzyme M protein
MFSFSSTPFTKHYYPTVADFENQTINLDSSKYIDELTFDSIKNYELTRFDVFISAVGVIPEIPKDCTISLTENAHKVTTNDESFRDYLLYVFNSESVQYQLTHMATKTGTPKLSIASLKNITIPNRRIKNTYKIIVAIHHLNL